MMTETGTVVAMAPTNGFPLSTPIAIVIVVLIIVVAITILVRRRR